MLDKYLKTDYNANNVFGWRESMQIQLSDHFSYGRLLRFTFPAMVMMVFTSLYGVVDGLFVTNFAGKTALAAINFAYPVLIILATFGYMFGTGGSALVAKTMGERKEEKANRLFSKSNSMSFRAKSFRSLTTSLQKTSASLTPLMSSKLISKQKQKLETRESLTSRLRTTWLTQLSPT